MLYEGTNGVAGRDLGGRKLPQDGGRALQAFFAEVTAYAKERGADTAMTPYVKPLSQSLGDLQQATMWFLQNALGNPDNAGAGATDYMHLFGLVALGYMWCLIAEASKGKAGAGGDGAAARMIHPVGEAAADSARTAVLVAGYGDSVPGVQINRFCASGLDAVNFAAAQIMSGQQELAVGGGVESMSRVGIGSAGGAWSVDPSIAVAHYFLPQGGSAHLIATKNRFSPHDVDASAVETQKRGAP